MAYDAAREVSVLFGGTTSVFGGGVYADTIEYGVKHCLADVDHNGFVNGSDFDTFADRFDVADIEADLNKDGFVNGDDYDLFAEAFELGC